MNGKVLGKIDSVRFGFVRDYPFLFGLQLTFSLSDGTGVGTGSRYTVNISDECRWDTPDEREKAITELVDEIASIMKDAKVDYVSELKNKPVEVTIEGNMFARFRILTEVL